MPRKRQKEITLRGFILGGILTVIFITANIYLGLKVGMTFTTSIPAAVISMALLKLFHNTNPLENNIVQTIASSAGALAAVIFVLPALIMIQLWVNFPFWQTTLLCLIGGIFGVMFTIPLRRALVVNSSLPYPEGTAAAEVLRIHEFMNENVQTKETPIKNIFLSTVISFIFSLFSRGFHILADAVTYYGRIKSIVSGSGIGFSFALIGAGYLVGARIGLTILTGTAISWLIAVPIFSLIGNDLSAHPHLAAYTLHLWTTKVRYIGVGTMGTAAIVAIIKLAKPVKDGIRFSLTAIQKKIDFPAHDKDLSITWVGIICAILTLPLLALFTYFSFHIQTDFPVVLIIILAVLATLFAISIGFLVAAASGYMAGLIGSSNSPISGLAIISIMIVALTMGLILHFSEHLLMAQDMKYMIGLTLFITSSVVAMAAISNDNLQDLKTGHLIGATPWKQQLALIFGVSIGALFIAPVLNQLYHAYGFAGALPRPDMNPHAALPTPQATLMTMLARGIIGEHMAWHLIMIGIAIGVSFLILNYFLEKGGRMPISLFSISFGIYLPPEINIPVVLGSLIAYAVNRKTRKSNEKGAIERRGKLFACGLIVGESLFGILLASLISIMSSQNPLALVTMTFKPIATILGTISFAVLCYFTYAYIAKPYRDLPLN